MKTIFEISSKNYEEDKQIIIKTLEDLEILCKTPNSYKLSQPMSRFGWTFFKLWLQPNFILSIEENFADMIKKSKGSKPQEKFTRFMTDFFNSKGCKVKLKLTEED